MKLKTNMDAGIFAAHHSESQLNNRNQGTDLRVKTRIRASTLNANHNETYVQQRKQRSSLPAKILAWALGIASILAASPVTA